MVSEPHDWAVPAPLRALLWWPPLAFFLVLLEPSAAAGTIAATGAGLAVLGVAGTTVGRVIARRRAVFDAASDGAGAAPVAIADRVAPQVVEQQAA